LVKVGDFDKKYMAESFIQLLEGNEIIAIRKERGSGNFTDIYMGQSAKGYEIYVNESDFDRAKALYDELESESETEAISALAEEFGDEVWEDNIEDEVANVFSKRKKFMRYYVIGSFVAIAVLILIALYMSITY